jgi:hypothetical protein
MAPKYTPQNEIMLLYTHKKKLKEFEKKCKIQKPNEI